MLFNSIHFVFFFPLVVLLYFLLPARYRWILLLAASYYFYMAWMPEYALLILLSTVVDYIAALKMGEETEKEVRKKWLWLSLVVNLGLLFTFKYFNFFTQSIADALAPLAIPIDPWLLKVALPVGISFYTFQTLSYSIDVYRGDIKPERHFGYFALYVSFFPQLVAGPIERPGRLIPQLKKEHQFDEARVADGLKLIAWGFFLKLVIADRIAPFTEVVYGDPSAYVGWQIILATLFFAFQIFCDFAGYSLIARGAARVMGYELMKNFRRPYFAGSIREFWQRWHISLSTWFRDYVYIPLGGNRVVKWRWHYNLIATFLISGLWHGANWTYVAWGLLHGCYLVLENSIRPHWQSISKDNFLGKLGAWLSIPFTFLLVCFAWVFFVANSIGDAFTAIENSMIFSWGQLDMELLPKISQTDLYLILCSIGVLLAYHAYEEWTNKVPLLRHPNSIVRWTVYVFLIVSILGFGVFSSSDFIYFQF